MTLIPTLNRYERDSEPPAKSSALDRTGQATDDAALGDGEEEEGRQHRQRGEGEHPRGVSGVLRLERRHAQWQGEVDLVVEHQQRKDEEIPAGDEGQNSDRRQRRRRKR